VARKVGSLVWCEVRARLTCAEIKRESQTREAASERNRRHGTNLGALERVIRGAVGLVLIAIGLFIVKGVIGVVLGLLGALLIFSGTVGFCHVYKVFHIHASKRA
jgi:uncharacterized membrane protein